MTSLLSQFVSKTDFESYEDFQENFKILVPENFNFAYDIVDAYAGDSPEKIAMVWCDDYGGERIFTFKDMKYYSDKNPGGFVVDGRMDDSEIGDYKDDPDNWRCILGPQGWMVHRSLWDEEYKQQASIKMKYIDDIDSSSPPDYFPGNLGYYYTESVIEYLEPRKYFFQLEWYWPYRLYTPSGPDMEVIGEICNIRDHTLLIKVGGFEEVNSGALLTPMTP